MNNLNITYTGKVSVRYEKNGKILKSYQIHNKGTSELFRYLCYCLTNDWANYTHDCPEYIMLYKLDGDPTESNLGEWKYALNSTIFKAKVETIVDSSYKTKFRFIIPTNSLIIDSGINVIAIYSSNNRDTAKDVAKKPSAYAKLVNSEGENITLSKNIGTNIIIDWEMSFDNSNTNNNQNGGNE